MVVKAAEEEVLANRQPLGKDAGRTRSGKTTAAGGRVMVEDGALPKMRIICGNLWRVVGGSLSIGFYWELEFESGG